MSQHNQPNWIVLGSAALATILVVVTLLVPWATTEITGGGFTVEFDYTLWNLEMMGEERSWFAGDHDEKDGLGLIRAGTVTVVTGAVLLLVGTIVSALPSSVLRTQRILSAVILIASGAVITVGSSLYLVGASDYSSANFGRDSGISAGTILAFTVAVVSLVAGILGLVMKSGPQIRIADDAPQKA